KCLNREAPNGERAAKKLEEAYLIAKKLDGEKIQEKYCRVLSDVYAKYAAFHYQVRTPQDVGAIGELLDKSLALNPNNEYAKETKLDFEYNYGINFNHF
ncbi:MAG: hypothetical protein K2Q14_08495, partial [Gammaproteobacteria bacterium]|nr:hypothetical protein [Gammaproteobacteria bacterium]